MSYIDFKIPYVFKAPQTFSANNSLILTGSSAGAAGTAAIKLLPGTLLVTPEAGVIEYNGHRVYVTQEGPAQRPISVASNAVVADVTVANTVTETTIKSVTIQPESQAGKYYRIPLWGKLSCVNAVHTITIRLKEGANTIATEVITPGVLSNKPWHIDYHFVIRTTGAGGTYAAFGAVDFNNVGKDVVPVTGSIDTTASDTLSVTVQWSDANAGNSITLIGGLLEDMN